MQLKTFRTTGAFTLVEIMIVVGIIGLLAALAVPNFLRSKERAQLNSIYMNLNQIDGFKQQWSLENRKPSTASPTQDDLAPYFKNGFPSSVAGETYVIGTVNESTQAVLPPGQTLVKKPGPFTSGDSDF